MGRRRPSRRPIGRRTGRGTPGHRGVRRRRLPGARRRRSSRGRARSSTRTGPRRRQFRSAARHNAGRPPSAPTATPAGIPANGPGSHSRDSRTGSCRRRPVRCSIGDSWSTRRRQRRHLEIGGEHQGRPAPLGGLDGAGEKSHRQRVALSAGEDVDVAGRPVVVDQPDRDRVAELPGDRPGERVVPDRPSRVSDDRRWAVERFRPPR